MGQVVFETPLSDSKKEQLATTILNLLVKEQLSLNQIQEVLLLTQNEVCKIPIVGSCKRND